MTVTEVASGGAPAPYTHRIRPPAIVLRPPSKAGEPRQFSVKYHGVPAGGLLAVKNKFGDRCFFSVNWPDLAHQWLPTIDHPYDKATSEFLVTAPAKYQVVSNGLLEEEIDLSDGRRTTHWKQSVPIATWLDHIGVAQFSRATSAGRRRAAPDAGSSRRTATTASSPSRSRRARPSNSFNDHIGPYPYEKLAGVEAAGMGGGMEEASAIFLRRTRLMARPAIRLVAHETAHQWFGDSVTEKDWDDAWLSEGFATYFAQLADRILSGARRLCGRAQAQPQRHLRGGETHARNGRGARTSSWAGAPSRIVYQKGGWVLHMLRGQIGTEKFWDGIREYYRRYRDGNASTADLGKSDGGGLRLRPALVLPAVAPTGRLARSGRDLALRPGGGAINTKSKLLISIDYMNYKWFTTPGIRRAKHSNIALKPSLDIPLSGRISLLRTLRFSVRF